MHEIRGNQVDTPQLQMKVIEMLFAFDSASTYTTRGSDGRLYLAHWIDEDDDSGLDRYLVVPTSDEIVQRLKLGTLALRDALDQPWTWAIDLDRATGTRVSLVEIDFDTLPLEVLPLPGVGVNGNRSLLSVDFTGQPGAIPRLSSVKQALGSVQSAFRKLALAAVDIPAGSGRPPNSIRSLYDWPVTNLEIGSLHIEFGSPSQATIDTDSDLQFLRSSGELLETGAIWASGSGTLPEDLPSKEAVLAALTELAPSPRGEFSQVVVSSRYFRPVILKSDVRSLVAQEQAEPSIRQSIRLLTGLVRELDRDLWTFIIRDGDEPEARCVAGADFEATEELVEAFSGEIRVVTLGVTKGDRELFEVIELLGAERPIGKVPVLRIDSDE